MRPEPLTLFTRGWDCDLPTPLPPSPPSPYPRGWWGLESQEEWEKVTQEGASAAVARRRRKKSRLVAADASAPALPAAARAKTMKEEGTRAPSCTRHNKTTQSTHAAAMVLD